MKVFIILNLAIAVIARTKYHKTDYLHNITNDFYTQNILYSDKPWLIHFGREGNAHSHEGIRIYHVMYELGFTNLSYGFVDVKTYEGELLQASFDVKVVPSSFYISSH